MSEDAAKAQPSPGEETDKDEEPTLAQRRMEIYR